MYIWGIHISIKIPKTVRQNAVCMPFWTRKIEAGVGDFKWKTGNSQVEEKEQRCGKQIFVNPSRNSGTQRGI